MSKSITVSSPGDVSIPILLSYSIETSENLQTIFCCISGAQFPTWLQIKKFELLSIKEKNGYTPLFNEINNSKNMATSLFIDKVYGDIMTAEKCKILVPVG